MPTVYRMPSKRTATKKDDTLDSPRIRFNWGFHDATFETRHSCRRSLVDYGPHDEFHVSRSFNEWYYFGYSAGLAVSKDTQRPETSEPAWIEFLGELK
jgi:hypothetical protein